MSMGWCAGAPMGTPKAWLCRKAQYTANISKSSRMIPNLALGWPEAFRYRIWKSGWEPSGIIQEVRLADAGWALLGSKVMEASGTAATCRSMASRSSRIVGSFPPLVTVEANRRRGDDGDMNRSLSISEILRWKQASRKTNNKSETKTLKK